MKPSSFPSIFVGQNAADDKGFGQVGRAVPDRHESDADDIAVWYRYGEEEDK